MNEVNRLFCDEGVRGMDETTSDDACAPAVLAEMTSELVAVYVSHNRVQPSDLPALIASVHAALANIGRSPEPAAAKPTRLMPIRKTVSDDHIISLEDGRPYKALKRHLAKLGLTPQSYREKWGLPLDYPMVAPAYARARSALAKEMGLGSLRRRAKA